jgi:hypothetical protein
VLARVVGLLLNLDDANVAHRQLSSRIIMPVGFVGQMLHWGSSRGDINAAVMARLPFLVGLPAEAVS